MSEQSHDYPEGERRDYEQPEQIPVHEAIRRIKQDVGVIGKNATMTQGANYSYRGVEDVVAALHEPLVRHGVLIVPHVIGRHFESYSRGENKQPGWSVRLTVAHAVYGPMGDKLADEVVTEGEAMDVSDKASNKAMTA